MPCSAVSVTYGEQMSGGKSNLGRRPARAVVRIGVRVGVRAAVPLVVVAALLTAVTARAQTANPVGPDVSPPVSASPPAPSAAVTTTTLVDTLPPLTTVGPTAPTTSTSVAPVPTTTLMAQPQDPTLGPICAPISGVSPSSTTTTTTTTTTTASPAASPGGCRIVAYYGNPLARGLGILGRLPKDKMLDSLAKRTAQWQVADPQRPTRCAMELIAIAALASPGPSGLYRGRTPAATIDQVLGWARAAGCVLIIDIQVGWSSVALELPYLQPWLDQPDVHLALDPEWDMPTGVLPGKQIGTMDAGDINSAIFVLSRTVRDRGLPPKMLVVHRFRDFMVTRPAAIAPTSEIRLVVNMDGFGPPQEKLNSYRVAKAGMPTTLTGYKLFTLLDKPMLEPADVLPLTPAPVFINYQ
jgi:hypothetical protein